VEGLFRPFPLSSIPPVYEALTPVASVPYSRESPSEGLNLGVRIEQVTTTARSREFSLRPSCCCPSWWIIRVRGVHVKRGGYLGTSTCYSLERKVSHRGGPLFVTRNWRGYLILKLPLIRLIWSIVTLRIRQSGIEGRESCIMLSLRGCFGAIHSRT